MKVAYMMIQPPPVSSNLLLEFYRLYLSDPLLTNLFPLEVAYIYHKMHTKFH